MNRVKKAGIIFGCLSVLLFSLSAPVFAADPAPALPAETTLNKALLGPDSETKTLLNTFEPRGYENIKQPGMLVFEIIQIILGFLGIASVLMMMYGGFLWITAGGEEDKAKKGTTILFQAVMGAIIVTAAYTVTYFVLVELSKAITQ
ncbi:hypothetical protein HY732_03060 [Candidatus Uhrbacteria bacterium]|nr:hypothetical protein [Candidatus Uhrbacteria bacterium]